MFEKNDGICLSLRGRQSYTVVARRTTWIQHIECISKIQIRFCQLSVELLNILSPGFQGPSFKIVQEVTFHNSNSESKNRQLRRQGVSLEIILGVDTVTALGKITRELIQTHLNSQLISLSPRVSVGSPIRVTGSSMEILQTPRST